MGTAVGATAPRIENLAPIQAGGIDGEDRRPFIAKVFAIVAAMIGVTFGWILIAMNDDHIKLFVSQNIALMIVSMIIFIVMGLSMMCFHTVLRKAPASYIFLSFFTLVSSYVLSSVTLTYSPNVLLYAIAITFALVISLALLAILSPIDFTGIGGYLATGLLALIFSSIIASIMCSINNDDCEVLNFVFAAIGVVIFSMFLVYDIQMIVGGSHRRYQFNRDDYVIAAVSVYLDIINLFFDILNIISRND